MEHSPIEAIEFALRSLSIIGGSALGLHLLGTFVTERIRCRTVPLIVLGLIHPHAALTTAREMGLNGRELLIAKISFNSASYTATACVNALTLLGPTIGGPYALALTLVDVTETSLGGFLLRHVRVRLPEHENVQEALRKCARVVARIAAYLIPGTLLGSFLSFHLSDLSGYTALATFLANPVAGCATIGAMVQSGALDGARAYSLAVTGAVLAYVGRLFRSCGPITVAVAGLRSGSILSMANLLTDAVLLLTYGAVVGLLTFGASGVPVLGLLS